MKIVVDMSMSALWVACLTDAGHDAVHWSSVGDARAKDRAIMEWAARSGRTVLTNDLDFGAILAATGAASPSVL
jgi:predicted nuclease of predicted toxin-antitoxin system